jgi:hypothetical protein
MGRLAADAKPPANNGIGMALKVQAERLQLGGGGAFGVNHHAQLFGR